MKKLLLILSLGFVILVPITSIAKSNSDIPEYTVEGLKLVPNTENVAYVWAEPGADLSQYDRVFLAEPYVAFRKNWKRDQNSGYGTYVTNADMNRIKANLKELFVIVFTEELEKGGYVLTDERAEDVLLVKPAIIDLDVNAPAVLNAGVNRTLTTTAGSMTLYMELFDSETDDLLAKAMDPTKDRDNGSIMQFRSGQNNGVVAMELMRPWAVALVNGLNRSREVTRMNSE